MEIGEELMMGSNYDQAQAHIVKGRRTKRQRSSSPCKAALTASSSSSGGCGGEREKEELVVEENGSVFSSTTSSSDVYESTEEEEDMANCLILLAQGEGPRQTQKAAAPTPSTANASSSSGIGKVGKFGIQKFSDLATSSSTTNKASFYVYECKTCNRSFPSFQALGGHRASHKKPRPTAEETKKPSPSCLPLLQLPSIDNIKLEDCSLNKTAPCPSPDDHVSLQIGTSINANIPSHNNINNKITKVHECSICGSEFNSGQALGGHMRRHRANTVNINSSNTINQVGLSGIEATGPIVDKVPNNNLDGQDHEATKPRNFLPLDLNLPAPEDEYYNNHHHHHQNRREAKFEFVPTQQAIVFSAPALVDCHY